MVILTCRAKLEDLPHERGATLDLFTSTEDGEGSLEAISIMLSDQEKEAIQDIIAYLPPIDLRQLDHSNIFTKVELAKSHIPERVATRLIEFKRSSNEYGTLLIRNLPVDAELPPTPEDGRMVTNKTSSISEYCLLLMMMYLGEPIAYADEKEGALIQNICPVKGFENRQENAGSVYLEFHTEDGFHPHKPDHVGLYCLKSDHEKIAKTASASIRRALPLLPSGTISLLRQPLFHIRASASFTGEGEEPTYSSLMPVLSEDLFEPELCVDFFAMEAINSVAQVALDMLKSALLSVTIGCVLTPGDLMIVDNRVAAHARNGFKAHYDGTDRWLQRMFIVQDFRRSRASRAKGGHIVEPLSIELFSADE